MLAEKIESKFEFALIKTDRTTVAAQKTVAPFTPDPKSDIVTYNGTSSRS
jgi:hypothetical protein